MNTLQSIQDDIIQDPMNAQFTALQYKPIFMANQNAKILIIGQAPGIKTQEKGLVFKDKSGDTLRRWLGVDDATFYNSGLIAVLPMDFYYPGKGKTGDLPPRKEFAPKWHPKLLDLMPNIALTILIGTYAQRYYLKDRFKKNLTETVLSYHDYLPEYFVLVHPSPLNFRWFIRNPSFEESIIPVLRTIVKELLNT